MMGDVADSSLRSIVATRSPSRSSSEQAAAVIFNVQRFSVQDGPGIRTTVFFKGCPLRCNWCSNPESQNIFPEVGHNNVLCTQCGDCLPACSQSAITINERGISIDRGACTNCGLCLERCSAGALKTYGYRISLRELIGQIRKDEEFFRNSSGGITASGGEPLLQAQFVSQLFAACRSAGIHTALETSGFGSREALSQVLDHTDLVFFDLKLIDREQHFRLTHQFNDIILTNLMMASNSTVPLIVRVPFIPEVNDSQEQIGAVLEFVGERLGNGCEIQIVPYHRFGEGKYQMLDREYRLVGARPPSDVDCKQLQEVFSFRGLLCTVLK